MYLQPLVKFKSHLYYEDKDRVNDALKTLRPTPQSKIIFFKNGESQGEAFVDIYKGAYYPAFSIFRNATVSVNFGPNFKYPEVEEKFQCKGVSKADRFTLICILICCVCYITDTRSRRGFDLRAITGRYDVFDGKRRQVAFGQFCVVTSCARNRAGT